jgi:tetratricopeptide (TPR) repeat protein
MHRKAQRVLLIGWDAADWKLITPLLDAGQMPSMERLIDRGVMGNLSTLSPILSPLLWTSIATGQRADRHGILGFIEPDPRLGGIRPASSTSRKVKAIWNILSQNGLRTHVVNWIASHPAETINGVCVSDLFPNANAAPGFPWPVQAGTVHPAELEDKLAAFRVHPGDIAGSHLLPFVPGAAGVDQEQDRRLAKLAELFAECLSVHAAATWIMEHEPWDFMAVYYEALDLTGHHFMPYHPPRMEHISEADYDLYQHVVTGMYRFHDMMLERLIQLAGPEATVILVSDHGFHCDHLRPRGHRRSPLTAPEDWHRPLGIFCAAGPTIKRDELVHGASIVDVTPTILHLFGLPIGRDMEGRPLLEAFETELKPARIPSWEDVPGRDGMYRAGSREDPWEAQGVIDHLAALGYIETPAEDQQEAIRTARLDQTFNLALVHFHADRPALAAPLFEELVREEPREATFALFLAQCEFALGKADQCRRRTMEVLEREQDRGAADLLLGNVWLNENRLDDAIDCLQRAEQKEKDWPNLQCLIGIVYLRLGRWGDAERTFGKALSIDADNVRAHFGLALAYLAQDRLEETAEEALTTVGLQYHEVDAHYILGIALARLGRFTRAVQAFETCLALRPGSEEVHRWLVAVRQQPSRHRTSAAAKGSHDVQASPTDLAAAGSAAPEKVLWKARSSRR